MGQSVAGAEAPIREPKMSKSKDIEQQLTMDEVDELLSSRPWLDVPRPEQSSA